MWTYTLNYNRDVTALSKWNARFCVSCVRASKAGQRNNIWIDAKRMHSSKRLSSCDSKFYPRRKRTVLLGVQIENERFLGKITALFQL